MKKNRGDKPIGIITYIYMEISQGNSQCRYLYLKLKCHVFCFIFSLFSSTKPGNRGQNKSCPGGMVGTSGERV
jgi:hypothetical protein